MSLANNDASRAPQARVRKGFHTTRRSMLLRAQQRDEAALSTLCEVYWQPVYAFVRAHGVSRDLALDITQGVFRNLLRRDLRTLDLERGSRFRSWLKRVTRSHLLNVLKSSRRVARVEVAADPEQVPDGATCPATDVSRQDLLFDQYAAVDCYARAARKRVKDKEFPASMRSELRGIGVSAQRLDEELRALCEALA